MEKKFSAEDLYLNRAKFVMKTLGVWLPPQKESPAKRVYRFTMLSLQYFFLLFQLVYIVQVWGDLEAVSQASYLLFTQACLCFKVAVFTVKCEDLRELLNRMKSDIFKPERKVHENILENQARRIKRLLLAFMITSQTTCGLWALKPLFDDVEGIREFPFRMWPQPIDHSGEPWGRPMFSSGLPQADKKKKRMMPVGTENSPSYELGYACQLMTICMSAYMYYGVDSVFLSTLIFGCGQLEIVMDKLLNLKPLTQMERTLKRNGLKVKVIDDNYRIFIECIKRHQAVVAFTKLAENTYHPYIFFQLSGSVGLICMSALRFLVVDWKSMQFFSILTYVCAMIMQLFICCWCGHELTATSEKLFRVSYECQWYEQDVKLQKALHIAMMRLERPMVIRAGRYIGLSRQTFVSVLRMSYSYFAVLRQTRKE